MLRFLFARLVAVAIALALAAAVVPGVDIVGGPFAVLWLAALFGIVTAVLGPILKLLSFPLTVLTLGLFTLVVNGVLLAVVAGLSSHLQVGHFLWTMVAALLIALFAAVIDLVLGRVLFDRSGDSR